MPFVWPEAETLSAVFERFLAGDPVAQADLIAGVLEPLIGHLQLRQPKVELHLCTAAAEDAVLALIHKPSAFDKSKGLSLASFLRTAAERDLLNALARELRHQRGRASVDRVGLSSDGRNFSLDGAAAELQSLDDPAFAEAIASFSLEERAVFDLMHAGERSYARFAEALGIRHLPVHEQDLQVKRIKDRVVKRLQRAGGRT